MLLSAVLCSVGASLLSTLKSDSNHSRWIGYQVLYGLGIGAGFQTCNLAPQTVLPRVDVPIGMALLFFMQQLGGSVFLSVGQNVFSSQLVHSLSEFAGLDTYAIINTGATDLRRVVPPSELKVVVDAYSYALTRVFVLATALSACMILGALAMEWKSIKGNKASGDSPTTTDTTLEKGESKIESQSASETDEPIGSTEGTLSGEYKEKEMHKSKAWLMKALGKKRAN